jgi:hypothetical protein
MHAKLLLVAIALLAAVLSAFSDRAHSQLTAPRTAAAEEPSVDRMLSARRSSRANVPVDVRYLFAAAPATDQSATLQLAFIPRVAGQNLRVEFPASSTVTVNPVSQAPALVVEKAEAQGIYRHALTVTPRTLATEIRVLVSLDVAGGRYFGIFLIPLSDTPPKTQSQ